MAFSSSDQGAVDIMVEIPASADLSSNQFHFVRIDVSESDSEIELLATAGGQGIGILQDTPEASTLQRVRVRVIGISKLVIGDTVTRGDDIQSLGDGEGDTAAAADFILAHALASGVDQDIIEVIVRCPGSQNN